MPCEANMPVESSKSKKLIRASQKSKYRNSRSKNNEDKKMEQNSSSSNYIGTGANKGVNGSADLDTNDFKQIFDLFDKNHDGRISSDELGCVLRTLGLQYSAKDVEEMIKHADTNENGFVEYDEFLTMMKMHSPKSPQTDTDESTMEAFKVFDMDGNGYIDKYELKYVFRRLGLTLSDDDIRAMFQEADTNNDGFIDFSEFSHLLVHLT